MPNEPEIDDQLLVQHIARHTEFCPSCDYCLEGIKEAKCPECGAHLRLSVEGARNGWGVGTHALAVMATPLSIGVTMLILGIEARRSPDWAMALIGGALVLLSVTLMILAYLWREKRLPVPSQRVYQGLLWLLVGGASLAVFGLLTF